MSEKKMSVTRVEHKETIGNRVRDIADRLKQETDIQIKSTSRILSAAAHISENYDRLIGEVVDMVEEDIDLQNSISCDRIYTIECLKKKFKTLGKAKSHFGIAARSWANLVERLNESSTQNRTCVASDNDLVIKHLNRIEDEIGIIRDQVSQILVLIQQITHDRQ